MRGLLVHPITCRRDFQDISWLGSSRMWMPEPTFVPGTLPILTGLSLGVFWILQGVIPIGGPNIVNIERELPAFSQMQNAFMRPTPISTKIGFVLVVPNQPAAAAKET